MAFAGHARSIDLAIPPLPSSSTYIANVHPDRHHHIGLDESITWHATHGTYKSNRGHGTQEENHNYDAYDRNHSDGAPTNRISFRDAMMAGTDDMGNLPSTSLWIGNVPPTLTEAVLEDAFERFGTIDSAVAKPYKKCAFVNFQDINSAREAWHACHEKDMFDTGIAVYVRYQKPPSNLDKYSLKRKRTSTTTIVSISDDALRRSIPTGPRLSDGLPPTGPKAQQTSISPPPLRRRYTYRLNDQSDEERTSRFTSERHRQGDTYRPSYEDDFGEAHSDRRSSTQYREPLTRGRVQSQASTVGYNHSTSTRSRSERSASPRPRLPQQSCREAMAASKGLGIKGLATLRKEPPTSADESHKSTQHGMSIKGVAAIAKVSDLHVSKVQVIQSMQISQGSLTLRENSAPDKSIVQGSLPPSRLAEVALDKSTLSTLTSSPVAHMTKPGGAVVGAESKIKVDVVSTTFTKSPKEHNIVPDQLKVKVKRGFPHLSYLFEHKDKEDLVAQKARTTSPFGRLRASTRERSVESALTDPTPVLRPPISTEDACEKCKVAGGGGFIRLFKCNVPSCSKKLHSPCGNLIQLNTPTESEQKAKFFCDECLELEQKAPHVQALMETIRIPDSKSVQADLSTNAEIRNSTGTNGDMPLSLQAFVNGQSELTSSEVLQNSLDKPTTSDSVVHTNSLHARDEHASHRQLEFGSCRHETANAAGSRPINPPIEPRSMRDDDKIDNLVQATADRYKKTVTCPWWRKGNRCVRPEKDCMFAHHMTGIESPNGISVAKDWTCHDYLSPRGCHLSERDCLYSHTDTGLYVGVDGKASKKHLECWWWHYHGRCSYSEAKCTCAHRSTGLVAEEPMSKDAVRRASIQPSRVSFQDQDASHESQRRSRRSPSYSPPPPPPPPLPADTRSFSITQIHVQASLLATPDSTSKDSDTSLPRTKPVQAAESGVDPRLRRNHVPTRNSDAPPRPPISGTSTRDAPVESIEDSSVAKINEIATQRQAAFQPSKQSTMNTCKMCPKLVFKADFCTDCLKLTQNQNDSQKSADQLAAGEDGVDILADEISVETAAKPAVFAVPAPKILKRPRQASSSNLFASKRMRPDLTNIRSATYPSPIKSNIETTKEPITLEQLNRINEEKRAEKFAQALATNEPDSSMIEVVIPDGDVVRNTTAQATVPPNGPAKSQAKMLDETRTAVSRVPTHSSPAMPNKTDSRRLQIHERMKTSTNTHKDSGAARSRSGSGSSNSESSTPLATLRPRSDDALWSSGTSTQSPQETREKPLTVTHSLLLTMSEPKGRSLVSDSAGVRHHPCISCRNNHRRCLHTLTGDYDRHKCYLWQQERNGQPLKRHPPWSVAEQEIIKRKALEYKATLHADHETTNVSDVENERDIEDGPEVEAQSDTTDDEDGFSSLSDEIQIREAQSRRHEKPAKVVSRGKTSRAPIPGSSRMLSRSTTPERCAKVSQPYHSNFAIPEGMMLVPKAKPKEDLADVIARLKARGVVFEDSDTSDDEEDDCLAESKKFDPRIDPLLYYKSGDKSPALPIKLPSITKGKGLKNPSLIRHRQMMRNYHLFGNFHKQVNRKPEGREVIAMVERKDPDDILALPNQLEEKMTLQEFVGLQKGKELEACLGKVPLPRSKFTMELAFKEKDMGPELDAWGRQKRANKKEKPIFVIGM